MWKRTAGRGGGLTEEESRTVFWERGCGVHLLPGGVTSQLPDGLHFVCLAGFARPLTAKGKGAVNQEGGYKEREPLVRQKRCYQQKAK